MTTVIYSKEWIFLIRINEYFAAFAPFTIASYLLFVVCYFANFSQDSKTEHLSKVNQSVALRESNQTRDLFGSINSQDRLSKPSDANEYTINQR